MKGLHSRALEHTLQIMAMVVVETSRRRQPFGRLQLPSCEPIFATGARPQSQTRIGP